ncbi:MAG: hypothetical protein KDD53_09080, partial [Bdellovibrionales bacterium]|nr:hypothetical protein [Bdellovibrionales bacterium]
EGQLTAKRDGFKILLDLGKWWWEEHNLPLPLGVNVVNKKLGSAAIAAVAQALKGSIECALSSRTEALEYALQYGRGLSHEDADTFVGMYVNNYTLDLGEDGRRSINLFLQKGAEYGIISQDVSTEFFLGV